MSEATEHTIAFYNIENLFDTIDDIHTDDEDFLPDGKKQWTPKRYKKKLKKLGSVIAKIGDNDTKRAPIVVGLAEVENKTVLTDLVQSETLVEENYDFVHFDSSDERGIDVALLYKSDVFKVSHSEPYSVELKNDKGEPDYTRDILLVKGTIDNEDINIIVNHWSSRREGEKETEPKRIAAADVVNKIIKTLKDSNPESKIIVMGDFNDNPNNKSIASLEEQSDLYNPFKTVWSRDKGSLNYKFEWNLFDQILISTNFFKPETSKLSFKNADVYNNTFLTQYKGKYKGQPFRTYVGKTYKGGFSDHFPVFIKLEKS